MASDYTLEKHVLIESLKAVLPGLRNDSEKTIEAKIGKGIDYVAESFVNMVRANLAAEYDDDFPATKIVLIRAGAEQLQYVKDQIRESHVPVKISAKSLCENLSYLEDWYCQMYPEGGTKRFQFFQHPAVAD